MHASETHDSDVARNDWSGDRREPAHDEACELSSAIVRRAWRGLARAVRRANNAASDTERDAYAPDVVHQLRVACRRAQAAMRLARALTGQAPPSAARRTVRSLRQAAGPLRNADVHARLLTWLRGVDASQRQRDAIDALLAEIDAERIVAQHALREALHATSPASCRRLGIAAGNAFSRRSAARTLGREQAHESLRDAARRAIAPLAADVVRLSHAELRVPEHAHALRLAIKPLRYASEQLAEAGHVVLPDPLALLLGEAQRRLGESNDIASLLSRTSESGGANDLRERFRRVMEHRTAKFAQWWAEAHVGALLEAFHLESTIVAPSRDAEESPVPTPPRAPIVTPTRTPTLRDVEHPAPAQAQLFLAGQRLGVIDIGSNSIRLLLVELIDERHWNVLAEERAMTRLAHAIDDTGEITSEAMARSVEAITRFKAQCDRHQAQCRAFATAAVRDAANQRDFLSLVKDRASLTIEIISELDEGRLTYRSVARAHDLSHGLASVVDIGGGSLEVVTSVDGVLTSVTSMPLGAVRLTEHFGGSEVVAGSRYQDLKRHCDEAINEHVPRSETPPSIVVGCGGTFNTLLTLAAAARGVMIDRGSPAMRELGPIPREQIAQLIKQLRKLTLAQRLRVPGLPSDRADIVIAGLCAIERLLKHLRVDRVHGYPGGVREGLLLRWIDELRDERSQANATSEQVLREVRTFAARCRYERAHSEHVARLAVALFDQFHSESDMIPRLGEEPMERTLLEAAAVLHDVGMLVAYSSHHKHSARMIHLADFTTLSQRQRTLVALIARYHRRVVPKARHKAFAALTGKDQQIVRRLAAILRVADGLDRTHAGVVQSVSVRFARDGVRLIAQAQADASEELRAATQKGDLLAEVLGVKVRCESAPQASRA